MIIRVESFGDAVSRDQSFVLYRFVVFSFSNVWAFSFRGDPFELILNHKFPLEDGIARLIVNHEVLDQSDGRTTFRMTVADVRKGSDGVHQRPDAGGKEG